MPDQLPRRTVLRAAAAATGATVGGVLAACVPAPAPPTATPATPTAIPPSPTAMQPAPTITATPVPAVRLEVTPRAALVDAPVSVRLSGLAPGQEVTLRAEMLDDNLGRWRSEATYRADAGGGVDVATRPSLSGSYTGTDANGLFWSMEPDGGANGPAATLFLKYTNFEAKPVLPITFAVIVAGQQVATATLDRRFVAGGVTRTPIRERGLYGSLFLPPGNGPFNGVVTFGGSEGGLSEDRAALLASHGFAALALAYFHVGGLPSALADIPLEYFETALDWLTAQPTVRKQPPAVTGASRGGELSLLLGAAFPDKIGAVVAYVPSGVVWGSYGAGSMGSRFAWTYRGMPLPYLRATVPADVVQRLADERMQAMQTGKARSTAANFIAQLIYATNRAEAEIPVERTRCPVLLVSGEADDEWPSTELAAVAVDRLAANHFAYPVAHLHYPNAGHLIGPPHRPTTVNRSYSYYSMTIQGYGGTGPGNAAANADSWPKVLTFLDEHLNR